MMRTSVIGLAALALLAGCSKAEDMVTGKEPVLGGSLEGGPWLVEDLNGGGIIDNARIDLTFEGDDAGGSVVYGKSACNRYRGAWKQNGTTVKFGPLAGTMMACPPALMDLEQKFLKTMEAVTLVSFDATGAALLKAPDGRAIKIRREQRS